MSPLDGSCLPHAFVDDQGDAETAHVVQPQTDYPSAKSECGMQIAQRSISALSDQQLVNTSAGEAFDHDSVLYAQGIINKIKKNQTLNFLWRHLSEELGRRQWSIRFRGCSNPVDFSQYSGYILDDSDRLRVEFSGTIRPSRAGCTATVLSAEKARQIDVNISELHSAPNNGNSRLIRLMKMEASLK